MNKATKTFSRFMFAVVMISIVVTMLSTPRIRQVAADAADWLHHRMYRNFHIR